MGWSVDPAKKRVWSERLQRFAASRLTIAEFCALEHVSTAAFYAWRRKLGRASADAACGARSRPAPSPGFVEEKATGSLLPPDRSVRGPPSRAVPTAIIKWLQHTSDTCPIHQGRRHLRAVAAPMLFENAFKRGMAPNGRI
jgi:hypothetical protein